MWSNPPHNLLRSNPKTHSSFQPVSTEPNAIGRFASGEVVVRFALTIH
ncbi:hypothetical protein CKA32_003223 [Geitlerinema sp. FC II]|nr:hypothetical protein CKA32_003223 [Geitlerinema sp. FC II]